MATTQSTAVTADTLLTTLQELADSLGRPPTTREYTRYGEYSHTVIYKHFESWDDALRAAGLDPNATDRQPGGGRTISREDLLAELRAGYHALGYPPRSTDMRAFGEYSRRPYYREFGSWPAALAAADIPVPDSLAHYTDDGNCLDGGDG